MLMKIGKFMFLTERIIDIVLWKDGETKGQLDNKRK